MEELRSRIGLSLQTLEMQIFALMAQQFVDVYRKALEELDAWIARLRDKERYRYKDKESRGFQTLFGVWVHFRRRRYYDRVTKRPVYLLDEVLNLPPYTQISPALAGWTLAEAVMSTSYRSAANSLKALYGHPVISHESVRQLVLAMGRHLEEQKAEELRRAHGQRKVKLLFLEVDGMRVALQRDKKRRWVEEKLLTVHEGWRRRHPSSEEHELVHKRHFRTQEHDFWESASRFVYSLYDLGPDTVVVINGDRAPWIREGVAYFPRAIYQVDAFHLKRDLRALFGQNPSVLAELEEARNRDVTGAAFLARLAEAVKQLKDAKKRRDGEALLKDLARIPEAVVDYRLRLEAMGIATEGLRGLGAAESQVDTFSDRVKHRGRSWSRHGLAAIMELLCWRNTAAFSQVMDRVEELLARVGVSLEEVKEEAVRRAKAIIYEGTNALQATVPVAQSGRTASGGLSWWINRVISGAAG